MWEIIRDALKWAVILFKSKRAPQIYSYLEITETNNVLIYVEIKNRGEDSLIVHNLRPFLRLKKGNELISIRNQHPVHSSMIEVNGREMKLIFDFPHTVPIGKDAAWLGYLDIKSIKKDDTGYLELPGNSISLDVQINYSYWQNRGRIKTIYASCLDLRRNKESNKISSSLRRKSPPPDIKPLLDFIVSEYKPEKVILFGCDPRDVIEGRDADIDLLIFKQSDKRIFDRIFELTKLIRSRFGYEYTVEPIVYTPDEYQELVEKDNSFIRSVLSEGKILYGK